VSEPTTRSDVIIPALEDVDRDGALLEALEATVGRTRAEFLRRAAVGSAALLGALAAPMRADGAGPGKKRDTAILNYGLAFEYLQAGFYTEADRLGTIRAMPQEQALWARTLGAHERAHVRILKQFLGRSAARKPFFNYRGVTEDPDNFTRTAVAMEDLTVALLLGQAPRISDRGLRAALFSLLTVEARHASWARHIAGVRPVGPALDPPKTLEAVDRVVRSTHFIVSRPRTSGRASPRFTG
jgi:Ferritin-like domain